MVRLNSCAPSASQQEKRPPKLEVQRRKNFAAEHSWERRAEDFARAMGLAVADRRVEVMRSILVHPQL